jgi:glycerol-3-phosphate acyltransferase PlsY
MGALLLALGISYLVGAIPMALIVGHMVGGYDIRTRGSGNAGATNVYRLFGMKPYLVALSFDMFKGYAAVVFIAPIGYGLFSDERTGLYCGVLAVVGHIWTVFAQFKGGKGVAAAAGMFLGVAPWVALACIGVYLLVTLTTRYVALGSMSGAIAAPIFLAARVFWFGTETPLELFIVGLALASLIVYTHRINIQRLRNGTEGRTDFLARFRKGDGSVEEDPEELGVEQSAEKNREEERP